MPEYKIKPGGMHAKAMQSRRKVQVVGGGFGNGKTAWGCVRAIQLAQTYPGCNGLIAMATYAQLNDTIREEFYKWVPASSVKRWPTIADNTLIFKNGSKVNFRYIKQKGRAAAGDGQTSSNLLSATYDWALVDQIENPEITYKDFLDLMGRLRGSTQYKGAANHYDETMPKSGPRWLMLLANPSFNWVFHRLIKPWEHYKKTGERHPDLMWDEDSNEPMIEIFEASTYENAHNLEPDFIKGLEATYKGQFRDRYLGGEWGAFEGLIYPEFDKEKHMITKDVMMGYLFKLGHMGLKPDFVEGFDFGIASPSCYLCGFKDYRGRVFIIDGFYKANMTLQEIGNMILMMRNSYGPYVNMQSSVLADPAIFKRSIIDGVGSQADTIAGVLSKSFQIFCIPAQNDILNGIAKVSSYINMIDFPHFLDETQAGCLLYVAAHLTFFADEISGYFWKMNTNFERTDAPNDRNDHAMDVIKYIFSYFPAAHELLFNYSAQYGGALWNKTMHG